MKNYVVYEDRRLDNGKVFYVGMGELLRFKLPLRKHNPHWMAIVIKGKGFSRRIVYQSLDRDEACKMEVGLIKKYGRKNLANLTDGGEATSGYKFTDEAKSKIGNANRGRVFSEAVRKKVSEALKGNKYNLGNKASDETKAKMSKARLGVKFSEERKANMAIANKLRWDKFHGLK